MRVQAPEHREEPLVRQMGQELSVRNRPRRGTWGSCVDEGWIRRKREIVRPLLMRDFAPKRWDLASACVG